MMDDGCMIEEVLNQFNISAESVEPLGNGLINRTWKVCTQDKSFVLQRINDNVFHEPQHIAENIRLIADYLHQHHPEYLFVTPHQKPNGEDFVVTEEGFFRMFPFIPRSHTIDAVQTPQQAYEAAKQFGKFTRLLADFDAGKLKITIPDFHNLSLRYQQFLCALKNGNPERVQQSRELIRDINNHADIVQHFEQIEINLEFRLRVIHHDTKISNVLFDENNKGICVIDLDTVMPGYFISDVGDMMRTYLSPITEEETDFTKIEVRDEFYQAIVQGYFSEMEDVLSQTEKQQFFYAGKFMIYMQALRFLTDHLNNDVYYGAKYENHNFIRAQNQSILLKRLIEKEKSLSGILFK